MYNQTRHPLNREKYSFTLIHQPPPLLTTGAVVWAFVCLLPRTLNLFFRIAGRHLTCLYGFGLGLWFALTDCLTLILLVVVYWFGLIPACFILWGYGLLLGLCHWFVILLCMLWGIIALFVILRG